MHIVFLEFIYNWGGAPQSSAELAIRLSKHCQVSVVDPHGCNENFVRKIKSAGLDYHILCPKETANVIGGCRNLLMRTAKVATALPELLKIQNRAKHLLKKINPTVVCSNNPKSLAITGTCPSLRHIPLATFLRGWYRPDSFPFYAKWLYRKRCSVLFPVSYATRAAANCSGIPMEKMVVLQNPIDISLMETAAERPLDTPLPHEHIPVKILLPAHILQTKGQHTAIRALHLVRQAGHDAVLYLAGSIPVGSNQSYQNNMKELVEELDISDYVVWLGQRHDIPQLMRQTTVVILPTYTEGMPRTLLEAMALGKPVIATPVGGIMDLIINEMTGLLFEVDDHNQLARQMIRLIDHPTWAQEIGSRAHENMRINHSVDRHTQILLDTFTKL